MDKTEKECLGAFISYHNIIRPIEYPLISIVFFSAALFVAFVLFYFFSTEKHSIERIACYVGLLISGVGIIIGLVLRKKYLGMYYKKIRGMLYKAELWKYVFSGAISMVLLMYILALKNSNTYIVFSIVMGIIIITIITMPIIVDKRIEAGFYGNKSFTKEKMFIFESSAVGVIVFLILKGIFLQASDTIAYTFIISIELFAIELCTIYAIQYFLKLYYAKKHNLEEYLPDRPHPSPYTNWE